MFSLYMMDYNEYSQPVNPDDRDQKIAEERIKSFNAREGPRVGDFVILPDGHYQRFAHEWPDQMQTCDCGSFHLGEGYVSMSGSLDPGYKKDKLELTGEIHIGRFWFFHHGYMTAHNGIGLEMTCRTYRVI